MGDVLAELEDILRSKPPKERMTAREEQVLQACKAQAIRDFTVGACVSSAVVWIASRSLTPAQRFNISIGSAMLSGMWRFNYSLDSCLDRILGLQGSRMQKELANIILAKHPYNPAQVKLVSKHFYPEQVFNDLNPDRPFFRWRSRNFYVDGNPIHMTDDVEDKSYQETANVRQKQPSTSQGDDMVVDPLDWIFGDSESSKEISHSGNDRVRSRRKLRAHKRAHRHHQRADHSDTYNNTTAEQTVE